MMTNIRRNNQEEDDMSGKQLPIGRSVTFGST
jgi:hypothetical protein